MAQKKKFYKSTKHPKGNLGDVKILTSKRAWFILYRLGIVLTLIFALSLFAESVSAALTATALTTPNVNMTYNLSNSSISFTMTCTPTQTGNPTCTNFYNFTTAATCDLSNDYSLIPVTNFTNVLSIPVGNDTTTNCAATSQTISAINPGTVWLRCNTNSSTANFISPQCVKINVTDVGKPQLNASFNNLSSAFSLGKRINMTANVSDNFKVGGCMFVDNQSLPNGAKSFFNKSVTGKDDQCSQNFTIGLVGVFNFTVIVNDTSNNKNQNTQLITIIDNVPPSVSASLNNLSTDVKKNNNVNFTANVSDNAGLSFCQFIDNQTLANGAKKIINKTVAGASDQCSQNYVIALARGSVINFTVIVNDTSNNRNQSTQIVTVQNTPAPQATILFPINGLVTNMQPVPINITFPSDPDGDVLNISYYINGKLNQTSSGNVTINATDNNYILNVSIFDNVVESSPSANVTINFTVDTIAPTTTDNVDGNWHNTNQVITLTCSDATAGCNTTYYTTDGSTPTTGSLQGTSIILSSDGDYAIKYFSTDLANNSESVKTASNLGKVDKTPPAVNAGTDKFSNSQFLQDATASDATSGIASYLWTKVSGPGTITFNATNGEDVTVSADTDGNYGLRLTVTDNAGNSASDDFNLAWDTTAPTIDAHNNVTAEATSSSGADVAYTSSATHDFVDGDGTANCSPVSGSAFALGDTNVACNAQDNAGNNAQSTNFLVHVVDTTAPSVSVPNNITAEATSSSGAAVSFSAATASDLVDGSVSANCDHNSGDTFAIGTTTVTCTATDSHNNQGLNSFNILVQDTTQPTIDSHNDVTAEATSLNGAQVNYTIPATHDIVDGDGTANCSPVSGSAFALGDTNVACNAQDNAGNNAQSTNFLVHVVDTTAPQITISPSIVSSNPNDAVNLSSSVDDFFLGVSGNNVTWDFGDSSQAENGSDVSHAYSAEGSYIVTATANDANGNTGMATRTVYIVSASQEIADQSQETLSGNQTDLIVPANSPLEDVTITSDVNDSQEILLDFEETNNTNNITVTVNQALNITRNSTTAGGSFVVEIPANTTITSTDTGWNGTITVPTVKPLTSFVPDADSGTTASAESVVEVGFGGNPLTFNKGIRILIPGMAGKLAGYSRNDIFTKISNTCAADTQAVGDTLNGGECKVDVSSDLVIWTMHFTLFGTYTQTANPSPSGGATATAGDEGGGSLPGAEEALYQTPAPPASAPAAPTPAPTAAPAAPTTTATATPAATPTAPPTPGITGAATAVPSAPTSLTGKVISGLTSTGGITAIVVGAIVLVGLYVGYRYVYRKQ